MIILDGIDYTGVFDIVVHFITSKSVLFAKSSLQMQKYHYIFNWQIKL
jgi:hypothetical protein